MNDDIEALTNEANRIAHSRWFACENQIKPWMVRVIEEAKERLRKRRECRTKIKRSRSST